MRLVLAIAFKSLGATMFSAHSPLNIRLRGRRRNGPQYGGLQSGNAGGRRTDQVIASLDENYAVTEKRVVEKVLNAELPFRLVGDPPRDNY